MIADQDPTLQNSVIRKQTTEFAKSLNEGANWFKHKHGAYPTQITDIPLDEVIANVKGIHKNYARKVL